MVARIASLLIAEDSKVQRQHLVSLCHELGVQQVHEAANGAEALALLPAAEAKEIYPPVKGSKEFDIVLDERLGLMDAQGVDMEVLSINPWWYRKERDLVDVRPSSSSLAIVCSDNRWA